MRKTVPFSLSVVLLAGCEALTHGIASKREDISVGTTTEEVKETDWKRVPVQAPHSEPAAVQWMPRRAKSPGDLFETVAPSVVVVVARDASGEVRTLGSGVVVAPGQVITNCHVLKLSMRIEVTQGVRRVPAILTNGDPDRDLCRLGASGLSAPPVRMGTVKDLKVGSRVYAVGAPQGLELTLSDGLVSGLREIGGGTIIQTTAPISEGSSGGGLFDGEGRLVGITTFYLAESQGINFALPVDWIAALPPWVKNTGQELATSEVWLLKAAELEKKRDWLALVRHAQRWTEARPDDWLAWVALGEAYLQSGEYPKAVDAFCQGLRINPEYAGGWYNLGVAYGKSGQTAEKIDAFRQALRIDPEFALAWHGLGFVYWETGQTGQAIAAYRQALRIDPEDAMVWKNLGVVYAQSGQTGQAIAAFRQALRIDPEDAKTWAALGAAYKLDGQTGRVMEVYRRLKALDPKLAEWFFNELVLP